MDKSVAKVVYNLISSNEPKGMKIVDSFVAFISGKKTYIVGFLVFTLGGLSALGVEIPSEAYVLLAGLGVMTGREAIEKLQK